MTTRSPGLARSPTLLLDSRNPPGMACHPMWVCSCCPLSLLHEPRYPRPGQSLLLSSSFGAHIKKLAQRPGSLLGVKEGSLNLLSDFPSTGPGLPASSRYTSMLEVSWVSWVLKTGDMRGKRKRKNADISEQLCFHALGFRETRHKRSSSKRSVSENCSCGPVVFLF